MIRTRSPFHLFAIASALLMGAAGFAGVAAAQSAAAPVVPAADPMTPGDGDTIRLSDEERADIIEHNTSERAAEARGELPDSGVRDRGVHGEVGFMIGTHGARGAYGTADVPLGDHASASIAVESERYDYGYRRR